MPSYAPPEPGVNELIKQVTAKWHHDLVEHLVTIGSVFAHARLDDNGEPRDVPLKFAGYRAAAVMRINSLKEHVQGLPDCTLTIDGDLWPQWTEERRRAIVDHELMHVVLARDSNGDVKYDDCERPRLKLRLHDYQFGGFTAVAQRHGAASLEVSELERVTSLPVFAQLVFVFAEEGA